MLLFPGIAGAQGSPSDAVSQIREQVLYAQYREALAALESYLARDDLDAAGRNAGLELLVTIHIARRQEQQARTTLVTLYARDPQHRLSESDPSPPVLSAFGRARENPPEPVEVSLIHEPPSLSRRTPPTIEVEIAGEGADAVQEVRLRYRQGESRDFNTVVMNVTDGVASARLPLLDVGAAYDVVYTIEATAPSGAVLGRAGGEDAPLLLHVPEATGTSVAMGGTRDLEVVDDADDGGSLAWLWITLSVAVVAGGVTLAVVLATSGGPEDGSLGNVGLPLVTF
jgi:hypothetical protein